MKLNTAPAPVVNHEGTRVSRITPKEELQRAVMSCLLWEDQFYENGVDIANRIASLVKKVSPQDVAKLAVFARNEGKLRHAPLLLVREMARHESHRSLVSDTLFEVIQRPDELTEFLAIYWKDGKVPLANQVKKGLARAFTKFNEYALAKYNRDAAIKLRDVLFLCHAKPKDAEQENLWKRLINNELVTPDTWEVELSASKDKKASWTRLLSENKLGALALLRNLRNMQQQNVDSGLIRNALSNCKVDRVLPYRFISAATHAPKLEPELEKLMFTSLKEEGKLKGKTVLLIDVSGSMNSQISSKSDLRRIDAACALAILARELCEEAVIYTFAYGEKLVPTRRGFALRDAIKAQFGGGTYLRKSIENINRAEKYDRMIVFTDEESQDGQPSFTNTAYILNVASYKNGVAYNGKATHVHGFSEQSLKFIQELENAQ